MMTTKCGVCVTFAIYVYIFCLLIYQFELVASLSSYSVNISQTFYETDSEELDVTKLIDDFAFGFKHNG